MAKLTVILLLSIVSGLRSVRLVKHSPTGMDEYVSLFDSLVLPTPPTVSDQPLHVHNFIASLFECLKLRDEKSDLVSFGCVPDVFSTVEDIPAPSVSNTLLSFIAINSSVSQDRSQLKSILNISEQTDLVKINSIHLRLHKNAINSEVILNDDDVQRGINISVMLATQRSIIVNHTLTITSKELTEEMWLDVHLDKYIANIYPGCENILNLTVSIKNSSNIFSLEDLGIEIENTYEPVLIMYTNEQVKLVIERLFSHSFIQHHQHAVGPNKRQIESSGYVPDVEKCRLIKFDMPYSQVFGEFFGNGYFKFNYCTGQCVYPLNNQHGKPFYHSILLAVFQIVELYESSYETSVMPPPCCIPVEYSAVSFPIKEAEWQYKSITIEDITAKRCSCR